LRRHRAPFPLSSLVDCCLFTPLPLPSRLPLPSPSSTLRHRRVVAGEVIVVAVVVIIVFPSTPPPPAFRRSLPPLLIVIFPSILGSFTDQHLFNTGIPCHRGMRQKSNDKSGVICT
jgi:hypothetical protein